MLAWLHSLFGKRPTEAEPRDRAFVRIHAAAAIERLGRCDDRSSADYSRWCIAQAQSELAEAQVELSGRSWPWLREGAK